MYKYNSMGAEEFGPSIPTATQAVTQGMVDMTRSMERVTGIPNIAYYLGVGLIGYVVYSYMNE